jgi:L,D-transpeptidase YcbB
MAAATTGILLRGVSAAAEAAPTREAEAVARYLESGGRVPGWATDPSFRAALSAEAEIHGLAALAAIRSTGTVPAEEALSASLRLARMLASGAVAPTSVQRDWAIPVPPFAAEAALRILVSLADPLPWLRSLAPQGEDYRRLRRALVKYHAIAAQGGWPLVPAGSGLKPGMSGERVAALQSRLKIEGDLAHDAPLNSVFDAQTEQAVRDFQSRHGLAADGRVGRATLAAMNVDALQRYRQIAANMERWRWLPRRLSDDRIMVDAAAASLVLFEDGNPVLRLRTIVGTPQHPTPVLTAAVTSLLINPPWDVPAAIAAKEIQPLARRDPNYLRREGMISLGGGKRLRQLPGPKNALGRIKFEMPNALDVYLHDTPRKELFRRTRRFFSHGCIRVENPQELALHLLRHDPTWTSAAMGAAISAGATRRVPIDPTVRVFVLYFTAMVEPDGAVEFREDAYHRDPPLIGALFSEKSALSGEWQSRSGAACRPA